MKQIFKAILLSIFVSKLDSYKMIDKQIEKVFIKFLGEI